MSLFLPLINIGSFWVSVLAVILLLPLALDGLIYMLVHYSFTIFTLMCAVNFNSLYGIIQPLVDRLQAVIIVFVVYLLGVNLIEYLFNPDKALEGGKKFLRNLFIATALFISYNFIFSAMNELNIALMGNSFGYEYTTLGEVFDLDGEEDKTGVLTRFIFGKSAPKDNDSVGFSVAEGILCVFIRDHNQDDCGQLRMQLSKNGKGSFLNIIDFDFAKGIAGGGNDNKMDYIPVLGFAVACFVIYTMFSASLQIGVRMFKLLILQMLAPIIIVDVIKNGFDGKFKTYLKKYISVFLEAFIRMLTILIITVFVSKFITHIGDYFPGISQTSASGFTKFIIMIIIVIAAYLFAGKVPAFIDEVIGTHLADTHKGNFLGGLLGGVAGLAAGAATGSLAGAVTGMVGGARGGSKGETVADFFKNQKENTAKARNVSAEARKAGGSFKYGLGRAQSAVGIPQRQLEQGQRVADTKTAMDDMIKNLEDYYDEDIIIGEQTVGVDRGIFQQYAYTYDTEENPDTIGFRSSLTKDTRDDIDRTLAAREELSKLQTSYQHGGKNAATYQQVEDARAKYQALKASTDKKIDAEFNTRMMKVAAGQEVKNKTNKNNAAKIKVKGRNAVDRSIETYNNMADKGYTTKDIIEGTEVTVGGKTKTVNTKYASDHYAEEQDKHTHSRSAERYTNSNYRGGGSK